MKSTGIIRKVDELGRIVLPKEMRTTFGIKERDLLEIFVDGDNIILKKYDPTCIFCGNSEHIYLYAEKNICKNCLDDLKKKTL